MHTNDKDSNIINRFVGEYSFLNNFYLSSVWLDGIRYPTAEHAYQSTKTADIEKKKEISQCGEPIIAKKIGKTFTLTKEWTDNRVQIMKKVVVLKFESPFLFYKLKETGNKELIHTNLFNDKFWGICRGEGQNFLGKILMEIRDGAYYE